MFFKQLILSKYWLQHLKKVSLMWLLDSIFKYISDKDSWNSLKSILEYKDRGLSKYRIKEFGKDFFFF